MLKFFMFMLVIHIFCVCGMFGPIFCISIHLHLGIFFTNHLICLHIKGVTGSLPTCHIWFFLLDFWPLFFMKLYVHIHRHNTHILNFWFLKICFPLLFSPFLCFENSLHSCCRSVTQSCQFFATLSTAARQTSLSFTFSPYRDQINICHPLSRLL